MAAKRKGISEEQHKSKKQKKYSLNIESLTQICPQISQAQINSLRDASNTLIKWVNTAIKASKINDMNSFIESIPGDDEWGAKDTMRSISSMIGNKDHVLEYNYPRFKFMKELGILSSVAGMQHRKGMISDEDLTRLITLCTQDGSLNGELLTTITGMQFDKGMMTKLAEQRLRILSTDKTTGNVDHELARLTIKLWRQEKSRKEEFLISEESVNIITSMYVDDSGKYNCQKFKTALGNYDKIIIKVGDQYQKKSLKKFVEDISDKFNGQLGFDIDADEVTNALDELFEYDHPSSDVKDATGTNVANSKGKSRT
ncbi:MAG: hypothetical protein V4694_05420 [Pseudomonadota bacterium]